MLQFERCVQDPVGEMNRTCRFLGIDPADEPPDRLTVHKQADRKPAPLAPAVSEELAAWYREDSRRLAELCPEIDLALWPSVSTPGRRADAAAPAGVR